MVAAQRLVFSTKDYGYMQAAMCRKPGFVAGDVEREVFPDGERYLRILSKVQAADAVVIGGTGSDAATLELFDLCCGLVTQGVDILSIVIPYFGYSTQERVVKAGEVVTAKARAVLLSAVPRARRTNEVILLDLHTAGISHYFEGYLHSVHLSAAGLVLDVVNRIAKENSGDTVVACTDAGRAKWVQQLANDAGLTAAFVYKARRGGGTTVTGVNADVAGKHVIVYDDMVRTGGSLIQAGKAYKDAGAKAITAIATHGVLPGDSLGKIEACGYFSALYCTDSLPNVIALARERPGFFKVLPVTGVLTDFFSN